MRKSIALFVVLMVFANVRSQDTVDFNSITNILGIYTDSSFPKIPSSEYIGCGGVTKPAIAVSVTPTKGMYVYGIAAPFWSTREAASDSFWHWVWQPEHLGYYLAELPMDTTNDNCFEYFQFYKKVASRGDTVQFAVVEQGMVHVLDTNVIGYIDRGADIQWFHRRYMPIRAVYFEHPIYVEDTFYIGFTNYNQGHPSPENDRTWHFEACDYSSGNYTTTQRRFYKISIDNDLWIDNHSSPTPWHPHTYYFIYHYIFPLIDSVPMYPGPLVGGGNMEVPVVKVENFVSVSPNPATGMATVKSSFGINAVELYDHGGALLLSQAASGLSYTIDLRPYAAGVYILKVRTPNGTATKKIVKQ